MWLRNIFDAIDNSPYIAIAVGAFILALAAVIRG
jgi:hypothetical protein